MKTLIAALQGEISKIRYRKKYFVFLILGITICFIWAMLGNLISKVLAENFAVSFFITSTPMGILPFFLHILLPFLIFMGISDLFTVEGADKTIKAMLMMPVERWKLFTAKILAVMTYIAFYLLAVLFCSSLFQMIFGDGEVFSKILTSVVSYAIVLIPLFVLACFSAMIALLVSSGTLTMFVLAIAYLILVVLPYLFPVMGQLLFTSYFSWYRLFIGVLPAFTRLANMLLIVFGYGAVFFLGGSLLFEKKEY